MPDDQLASSLADLFAVPEADQHFPHRPRQFPDRFPSRLTDPISEAFLKKKFWWWRYANEQERDVIFPRWVDENEFWPMLMLDLFRDHFERSAFFYEMRARYGERYQWDFGRPWIRCSVEQHRFLNALLPSSHPALRAYPSDKGAPNWVRFTDIEHNLLLSDETLVAQFKAGLAERRLATGITAPSKGQGTRRKPLSWRPVELMDIRRYELQKLTDSERSQLSKAARQYKRQCRRLKIQP